MTITEKNDATRKTFLGCRLILTRSVADSPDLEKIIMSVQKFDDFSDDNDPHGEHDFGAVTINGTKYFWKFDYYDDTYTYFQEDGHRILTIMRADEY